MYFVGVDLAWSDNNPSGVAVIHNNRLVDYTTLQDDQQIISHITQVVADQPCLVAIDAPLLVPNESGSRVAEKKINEVFRSFEAGAHPANRSWLTRSSGRVRGEDIVDELAKIGVVHNPYDVSSAGRKCFEVYPHPAMVVLFGLQKTLKYKPRQKRSYDKRWNAFERYQQYMRELPFEAEDDVLSRDVRKLRASALKKYEDCLDAIFCAYIAKYAHENETRVAVFGDMSEGYILTPVLDE